MASIAYSGTTKTVAVMQGVLPGPGYAVSVNQRLGIDYQEYQLDGLRIPPAQIRTYSDVATISAGITLKGVFEGWKGRLVTVVDQYGTTHSNVMVLDVRVQHPKVGTNVGGVGGTASACLVIADWSLQRTS